MYHRVKVQFIDEPGDDFGGLTKDLYTTAWLQILNNYFRGESAVVPYLPLYKHGEQRPHYRAIGRILSHFIALLKILPPRMSRCTVLCLAFGASQVSDEILLSDFRLPIIDYSNADLWCNVCRYIFAPCHLVLCCCCMPHRSIFWIVNSAYCSGLLTVCLMDKLPAGWVVAEKVCGSNVLLTVTVKYCCMYSSVFHGKYFCLIKTGKEIWLMDVTHTNTPYEGRSKSFEPYPFKRKVDKWAIIHAPWMTGCPSWPRICLWDHVQCRSRTA